MFGYWELLINLLVLLHNNTPITINTIINIYWVVSTFPPSPAQVLP